MAEDRDQSIEGLAVEDLFTMAANHGGVTTYYNKVGEHSVLCIAAVDEHAEAIRDRVRPILRMNNDGLIEKPPPGFLRGN